MAIKARFLLLLSSPVFLYPLLSWDKQLIAALAAPSLGVILERDALTLLDRDVDRAAREAIAAP